MGMAMHRWGLLILCLLVASFTTSAAVHASEFSNATTLECSGYVHTDGDADETQGDADRAVPHHHGSCHGAASVLPTKLFAPIYIDLRKVKKSVANSSPLGLWTTGPDLRPPIA
jgi:hypothetical protein